MGTRQGGDLLMDLLDIRAQLIALIKEYADDQGDMRKVARITDTARLSVESAIDEFSGGHNFDPPDAMHDQFRPIYDDYRSTTPGITINTRHLTDEQSDSLNKALPTFGVSFRKAGNYVHLCLYTTMTAEKKQDIRDTLDRLGISHVPHKGDYDNG